jgi:hypothetical protein
VTIIKRSKVQLLDGPPAPLPARAGAEPAPDEEAVRCEKEVRLVRLGGEVRAVELRCSCGETTTIELAYGEPGGTDAEASEEDGE